MSPDYLLALSFIPALSRIGLAERLRSDDPELIQLASSVLDAARRARDAAVRQGIHVVTWEDARYPAALLSLPDFPPAVWCRGHLSVLDAPSVAIVGSRAASAVALETATRLGTDLAARGVTVVSGLARGVDFAAHRGALSAGVTVAVLGSGVDVIYPREHALLAGQIAESGLVLSEYPPGSPPSGFHFPQRNRLISGCTRATVVVEAAVGSVVDHGRVRARPGP